ncbi:PadR family transcriptional regulator [Agromyces laixinhei]|uniref:PadR family transcriptional regulator n=1 Tax=Agromyces laixinhei TaxID=2585717 RepID=UPI001117A7F4|nr:helix-turn-helix transcriptional regulator [Agromyces laixinhei]
MTDHRLNATAASLLGFLHRGPMSGWDLTVQAQQVIGDFWSLTRSQVYRELTRMVGDGLIVAGARGSRERQPYELTDAGRSAFLAWANTEPGPETIRFPLLLKISFGSFVDAERLAGFIDIHRESHERQLAEYEAQAAGAPPESSDPYARATLTFGIEYERAVLAWFDALPIEIRTPRMPPDSVG